MNSAVLLIFQCLASERNKMPSEPPPDFELDEFDSTFERDGDFEGGSEFDDTHRNRLRNKMMDAPYVPIGRYLTSKPYLFKTGKT